MIRLTLSDGADLFVNPDNVVAVYTDTTDPNHYTRVMLDTGGAFQVKDDPAAVLALIEGKQR